MINLHFSSNFKNFLVFPLFCAIFKYILIINNIISTISTIYITVLDANFSFGLQKPMAKKAILYHKITSILLPNDMDHCFSLLKKPYQCFRLLHIYIRTFLTLLIMSQEKQVFLSGSERFPKISAYYPLPFYFYISTYDTVPHE